VAPPAEEKSSEQFLAAFDAFVQAVRRARGSGAQNGALTLSQYALLAGLHARPRARVQELAAQAGITPSTATRILDALERRGIVRRARATEDRRSVTVRLTARGRQLLRSQDAWLRARQLAFHDGLPADEKALAPGLLLRLAGLIDELAEGPGA
jgi:DNA-binding MarR family transcriptional regulator